MTYKQNHLRLWLLNHSLIKITKLEEKSKIPKGTLRHFKEERRDIPKKHFDSVVNCIKEYGFLPSDTE